MNPSKSNEIKTDCDILSQCLKVNIFNIDWYTTKPRLSHDKIYSVHRQTSAKVATVVRIFGSTDNGLKVCLHMHQYFPHFSIKQIDLATLYGLTIKEKDRVSISDDVIEVFIRDLEIEIRRKIIKNDSDLNEKQNETEPNESYIYCVESYVSTTVYGFHQYEEVFYRFIFYSTWAMDVAKKILQMGTINNCPLLVYNCLEFILQFYIDSQTYLNILYVKNVSFRRSEIFEKIQNNAFAPLEKEKIDSLNVSIIFNEIPTSSSCLLECDVTMEDIVCPVHVKHFPKNTIHTPSLPGIIKLWNDQYFRHLKNGIDYQDFISILKDNSKRKPVITRKNKMNNYIMNMFIKNGGNIANQYAAPVPPVRPNILVDNFDDNDDDDRDDNDEFYYDKEDEDVENDEMNFTLQELNLCNDYGPNIISRSLYYFDEPFQEGEINDEEIIIPQLDGLDDHDELGIKTIEKSAKIQNYFSCKFKNKKIKLNRVDFGRESIDLPKISLLSLMKNNKIIINDELKQKLLKIGESDEVVPSDQIESDRQKSISSVSDLSKQCLSLNDSIIALPESCPMNTKLNSLSLLGRSIDQLTDAHTPIHSTPEVSTWHGCSNGKPKNPRKWLGRRFSTNSCRTVLDNIFEQEELQKIKEIPFKENVRFILSQSSQISHVNTVNDISSLISANTTDQSFVPLSIESIKLKWTRCLEMTLMSLEVHVSTQDSLAPNPHSDPIQVVSFAFYSETLNDKKSELEGQQLNCIHIGAIVLKPNYRLKREEIVIGLKTVHVEYVQSEVDLLLQLSFYTKIFDPDIVVGYVVDTLSWGYLLQRSLVLGFDAMTAFSRIINPFQMKNNFAGSANKSPQLSGRIVLNLWTLLRHEVALRSYAFEHVHYHLLKERVPKYSPDYLSTLWRDRVANQDKYSERILLEYYITRVMGNIKMLSQLNLVSRTFDLSCLFGMRFEDVLNRGSQFRVESMLYPLFKLENFVPIRFNKEYVSQQASPENIPLVLEPECAFHSEPVAVLDFQSLYPSVMIAHNYCYTTCLGKLNNIVRSRTEFGCNQLQTGQDLLRQHQNDIQISPNGVLFIKPHVRRGLLPKMLEDLLYTRILVKNELKEVSKSLTKQGLSVNLQRQLKNLKRQLDVCQLGLKLIANVTYGYTSANFSGRMPCVDVADSIVSKGREALERAIYFIDSWGMRSGTGAKVIYGDTDSVFITFPGHTLEEAFKLANVIAQEITNHNPNPMKIKLEKIYQPCLLLSKKRYCGNAFECSNQSLPFFDAKGIEIVRRDNCNATSKILKKCIKILFDSSGNLQQIKPYIQWQIKKILNGRLSNLNDFVFAKEFWGLKFYSNDSVMPSCIIARQRISIDPRAEPKTRERVPYIIVSGSPKDRLADLVRDPIELLNNRTLQINVSYYIERAIFPPLVRILEAFEDFDISDLMEWYLEVRHFRANKLKLSSALAEGCDNLKEFFQTSLCVLCQNRIIRHTENYVQYPLCTECQQSSQRSIVLLKERLWIAGQKFNQLARICSNCTSVGVQKKNLHWPEQRHQCLALTCPYFFRYHQAAQDYQIISNVDQLVCSRMNVPTTV